MPTPRELLRSTKLHRPPGRANPVARQRLFERLDEGRTRKLTLISAPAGFGKTTLVTDWLARTNTLHAWLSLDGSDNDPVRFWSYIIAALRTLQPEIGRGALDLLQAAPAAPIEAVLAGLVNDLDALSNTFTLVLDDYHAIHAPPIHHALSLLIEQMPDSMHLCILTRSNPPLGLPRLRARDQLVELRAMEMRFTGGESEAFLGQAMGLRLSAAQIGALETRTEGWAAGLQLAALSLRGRADIDLFLRAFTGSHQYIIDYLVEEVLQQQPLPVQDFLVRTAILERLSGPLCDAALEISGGQEMLEYLQQENLFILSLDDERRWYRYHQLFADVLRHRLNKTMDAAGIATLHRRASDWYEQQGLAVDAIDHAFSAADWERVERLLRIHFDPLLFRGQVLTLLGWLEKLPDPVVRTHAHLAVRLATALLYINQQEKAETYFQITEQAAGQFLQAAEVPTMLGIVAANRSSLVRSLGDIPRCIALAQQALDLLPSFYAGVHASLRVNLAFGFLCDGRPGSEVETDLRNAITVAREQRHEYAVLRGNMLLARLYALRAQSDRALAACAEAINKSPEPSRAYVDPVYHIVIGDILLERNEVEEAERHLRLGMQAVQGSLTVDADIVMLCHIALARCQLAGGGVDAAVATLDSFAPLARQRHFVSGLAARVAAARAQINLARGNLAGAEAWASASGLTPDAEPSFARERELLCLARVLIAQGKPQLALQSLEPLLAAAENDGRTRSTIEILMLRSLAQQAAGNAQAAWAELGRALALAGPAGFVRLFVEEGAPMRTFLQDCRLFAPQTNSPLRQSAENLLRAFDGVAPATRAKPMTGGLVEPLSEREREVLRLVAGGANNAEIASQLYLAVGTVKRHISNIFGKLGVNSRTQAIVRARELKLIN